MKLHTTEGEMYFNPQLITQVHLSADGSLLTIHFVNGTNFAAPAETEEEQAFLAGFLRQLVTEESGFLANGRELLNLKAALWVTLPKEGPIQVRSADNRSYTLAGADPERVRRILGD
jgi:hypothetical protein